MLHNNVAIVVTLGGIREVFYGADGVYTPDPGSGRIGVNCIDLRSVGSFREEMPRFGGIAKPSGLKFTLRDRGGVIGPLFSRTLEGVTRSALSATLPAETDTASLTLLQDVSEFDASGYLYFGHETVKYSARDTGTKLFTVTERGSFGSPIAEHQVNSEPDKSYNPLATAYPVAWKGRKAVVTLHEVNGARIVATSGIELIRGFLAGEPEALQGGSWAISITQEIAKFDNQIADTGFATGLVQGKHYFDGENAVRLRFLEQIPKGSVIQKFAIGSGGGTVAVAALTDAELLDTGTNDYGVWAVINALFPTNPGALDLIADRFVPEHDPMLIVVTDANPVGQPDGVIATTPLKADVAEGTGIFNQEQKRTIESAEIASGLQDWPGVAVALFNDTYAIAGTDWRMLMVDAVMSGDAQTLTVRGRHVPDPRNAPSFRWDWALLTGQGWELSASNWPEVLWFPWLRPSDSGRAAGAVDAIDDNPMIGEIGEGESAQYRFPPPAKAFWQREKYLLVRDNIFVAATSDAPGALRVKDSDGREQILKYVSVATVADNGGYLIELDPEAYRTDKFQPFGDWQGRPDCVIEPYVAFVREDPRILLLRIMLSGFGSDVFPSATYSTLPRNFGLAIELEAIDVDGILSFPVPAPLRELTFRAGRPASAREMLDPILQGLGAALVMRPIGGVRKITLVKSRTVNGLHSATSMADGDWLKAERPTSGKNDDVINVFRMLTNYNADTDKFGVQVNFFDRDSIDLVRVTSDITLKLRGVEIEPEGAMNGLLGPRSALVSIYKTLRAQGGTPAREYVGGIGWSVAQNLSVGSVLLVSISDGRALDGSVGVASVPMLVSFLEINPVTKAGSIGLLYQGRPYTGINPSAKVAAVVDSDHVTLSENEYSDTHDPVTGARQYDWTFFAQSGLIPSGGVPVRLVHTGNESANTDGTITALNVLTGAATIIGHGLSVGDHIRSANWTDAADFLKVYAFLSQAGLFSDGTAGFVYS